MKESASSPQLMQTLCLQFCRDYNFRTGQDKLTQVDIAQVDMDKLFKNSSGNSNCLTIYNILRNGPKTRGSDRKVYAFVDRTKGDMYAAILKAMAIGEPTLAFSFNEIKQRIDSVIVGGVPKGISILSPLTQMDKAVKGVSNEDRVLEVDEEKQTITILDPHFLHYLRWAV
ncbi:MAG: hypothetical protein EOO61_11655 [Hymenobacter sp.]|nr:MAG: hypothetical protein EOO61_11655 [Hymenobacter sp.]